MEFVIQKENLLNSLNGIIRVVPTRSVQPVLTNVLIKTVNEDTLKIVSTDLDLGIELNIPATIIKEGSITLPAKKLNEIISKLPDKPINFSLSEDNNLTVITCGNSKFDLIGISADEFPSITTFESEDSIEIETEPLLKAIKQTVFSAANYDTSNVLSGVYCQIQNKELEMAATDGNRLSRCIENISNKENKDYSVIIPSRTLNEFSKVVTQSNNETVLILIKEGQILFKFSNGFLISRLLDGQYPKYQQLIPSNYEKKIAVNREYLISSLERTATMVNDRTSIIKFVFNTDKLQLSANTPDFGDSFDIVDLNYDLEEFSIAFNYKYVLETARIMDSENIIMELNTPLSAAILKQEGDESYLSLIMPVQIR